MLTKNSMPRKKANATNKHLLEFISETSGKNGVKIISTIGDGTTDEKIEKKTKLKMAEISMLRKMAGQILTPKTLSWPMRAALSAGEASERTRRSRGRNRKNRMRKEQRIRGISERRKYLRWIG